MNTTTLTRTDAVAPAAALPRWRVVLERVQAAHRRADHAHRARPAWRSRPARRRRRWQVLRAGAGGAGGLGQRRRLQPVRRGRQRPPDAAHPRPRLRQRRAARRPGLAGWSSSRCWRLPVGAAWVASTALGGAVHVPRRLHLRGGLHPGPEARAPGPTSSSAAWPAASRCWPARRRSTRRSARCRCCWRWCCSCGRRRISGAWRSPTAPTTPPPACRCCRWSWARARAARIVHCATRWPLVAASLLPLAFGAGPVYGVAALLGGAALPAPHAGAGARPAAQHRDGGLLRVDGAAERAARRGGGRCGAALSDCTAARAGR